MMPFPAGYSFLQNTAARRGQRANSKIKRECP
jgi:hypothetical protein